MKLSSIFLLVSFGLLLLVTGCGKDEDATTPAVTRDSYLGTYSVVETSTRIGETYTYTATISAGPGANDLIISNLSQLDSDVMATVSGSQLVIPEQTVDFVDYSGDGTLNGDRLSLAYENLIFSRDTLTAEFTRR